MVNRESAKVGDIVVMGGNMILKNFQKCSSVYFGVIICYTRYGNPRATVLSYKHPLI